MAPLGWIVPGSRTSTIFVASSRSRSLMSTGISRSGRHAAPGPTAWGCLAEACPTCGGRVALGALPPRSGQSSVVTRLIFDKRVDGGHRWGLHRSILLIIIEFHTRVSTQVPFSDCFHPSSGGVTIQHGSPFQIKLNNRTVQSASQIKRVVLI